VETGIESRLIPKHVSKFEMEHTLNGGNHFHQEGTLKEEQTPMTGECPEVTRFSGFSATRGLYGALPLVNGQLPS